MADNGNVRRGWMARDFAILFKIPLLPSLVVLDPYPKQTFGTDIAFLSVSKF